MKHFSRTESRCSWCGLATTGGPHRTIGECIEALQSEVERIAELLGCMKDAKTGKPKSPNRVTRLSAYPGTKEVRQHVTRPIQRVVDQHEPTPKQPIR